MDDRAKRRRFAEKSASPSPPTRALGAREAAAKHVDNHPARSGACGVAVAAAEVVALLSEMRYTGLWLSPSEKAQVLGQIYRDDWRAHSGTLYVYGPRGAWAQKPLARVDHAWTAEVLTTAEGGFLSACGAHAVGRILTADPAPPERTAKAGADTDKKTTNGRAYNAEPYARLARLLLDLKKTLVCPGPAQAAVHAEYLALFDVPLRAEIGLAFRDTCLAGPGYEEVAPARDRNVYRDFDYDLYPPPGEESERAENWLNNSKASFFHKNPEWERVRYAAFTLALEGAATDRILVEIGGGGDGKGTFLRLDQAALCGGGEGAANTEGALCSEFSLTSLANPELWRKVCHNNFGSVLMACPELSATFVPAEPLKLLADGAVFDALPNYGQNRKVTFEKTMKLMHANHGGVPTVTKASQPLGAGGDGEEAAAPWAMRRFLVPARSLGQWRATVSEESVSHRDGVFLFVPKGDMKRFSQSAVCGALHMQDCMQFARDFSARERMSMLEHPPPRSWRPQSSLSAT